jgi:hypothetical protein
MTISMPYHLLHVFPTPQPQLISRSADSLAGHIRADRQREGLVVLTIDDRTISTSLTTFQKNARY